jgi:hypothetical protein
MAGKLALKDIAKKLGRTAGATAVEASKLKVSLRTRTGAHDQADCRARNHALQVGASGRRTVGAGS